MALNSYSERSIALCGFMGAGKSQLGERFARKHGVQAIDLDRVTETNAGMNIPAIFKRYSELGFRALEREALIRVLGAEFGLLALGGGSLSFADNLERIKSRCTLVWIDCPFDLIMDRAGIQEGNDRPLLHLQSRDALEDLYKGRSLQYARSDHRLDGSKSPDELLADLTGLARQTGLLASIKGEHKG